MTAKDVVTALFGDYSTFGKFNSRDVRDWFVAVGQGIGDRIASAALENHATDILRLSLEVSELTKAVRGLAGKDTE